ncbi:MAG: tellurium resistance protein TerC, partial [Bacteroidota bacterium]|nr:tellurium resistance protein TerC [Bacteroidota bacterium]
GLTCLFFMIKSIITKFRYIKTAVFFILFFIGVKMLLFDFTLVAQWIEKRQWFSFVVIISTLVIAVLASVWIPHKGNEGMRG